MDAIKTDIPARLDRLPWSRFHLLVVIALGITWVLDGLEVTIVGSIGPILQDPHTLALTDQDIGSVAAVYVVGAVVGRAGVRLADRPAWPQADLQRDAGDLRDRRAAIAPSPGISGASRCSASSPALGIGGEYAAINSAIDELIPARLRGRIDLIVNGSYWAGAAAGAAASIAAAVGRLVRHRPGLAARLRHRRGARRWSSCSCAASCRKARAGR